MNDPEPTKVLICNPADRGQFVPGVTLEADCGHLVFVSASGITQLLNAPDTLTMCVPCATEHAKANPQPHRPQVIPGALADIEATHGTEARQDAERFAREQGWETSG